MIPGAREPNRRAQAAVPYTRPAAASVAIDAPLVSTPTSSGVLARFCLAIVERFIALLRGAPQRPD
jgi:hypothetical protein